ncbi:hypothetical protein FGF66_04560 [Chlorobaculum thiosulfatiphilum]|uniref:Uncharacterized protein n=1 Tax=Chlorobaculum thiosulfatiphilum TaxID=115852 RepID=A0A5C4S758_CHLTI|nr:hypothetical protein [Chlorobaculum thiosulfatiphilum]TNJ39383.1 hypothetical protein FGF66_04560 [Chlorobaculum thiosulfatiphilum]
MDLSSFLPFRDEMVKVYHCLTNNATHTSEKPVFSELKVRRYSCPIDDVAEFINNKIEGWVGWGLKNQKTAVGGMKTIRAEVSSFALLGMKIDVTFGLVEETDINGRKITTVNGKAHTRIDSKGDLGESRRMLRMMLVALDFEFRPQIVHEDEYVHRSIDPKNSSAAFQELFNESTLEHRPSSPKAKPIELKKPAKQQIEFKSSKSSGETVKTAVSSQAIPVVQNGAQSSAPDQDVEEVKKPAKPKITVISLKKNS